MKIYLYDTQEAHENLLPLSFTRPVADFRCGILTIREKWERYLPGEYSYYPVEYLRDKFGTVENQHHEALFIPGNLLPRPEYVNLALSLIPDNQSSTPHTSSPTSNPGIFYGNLEQFLLYLENNPQAPNTSSLTYVFDIFLKNPEEIKRDFDLITAGRQSQPLPDCVRTLCPQSYTGEEVSRLPQETKNERDFSQNPHSNPNELSMVNPGVSVPGNPSIFIEEGASVECATININEGPVYIGKDSSLMEGACIRGPFALCEGAEIRMGAKIYEGTTVGPHCKVGGEVANTVFFGYSNKAHDGYLGNAVIGEWCNIGAGTNASNLKNDYSLIRVWNYRTKSFMKTDLQFCGLIMGDHSKIGVNCMINTATVIGVGVNLHGSGFPRVYLSNFTEGSPSSGFSDVPAKKFIDTATRVMSRRHLIPSPEYLRLLHHLMEPES